MTMRREQTVALANVLGVEILAGIATTDLMDACLEKAREVMEGRGSGSGDDESEGFGEVPKGPELLPQTRQALAASGGRIGRDSGEERPRRPRKPRHKRSATAAQAA